MNFEAVGGTFVLRHRLRLREIQTQHENRIFYYFFDDFNPFREVSCIWVLNLGAKEMVHSVGVLFAAKLAPQQVELLE